MSEGTETLVVASKLKKLIKEEGGMNTSSSLISALSERVRSLCKEAIANAQGEGRKTVMDRDIP